jgi:hypothetical protein
MTVKPVYGKKVKTGKWLHFERKILGPSKEKVCWRMKTNRELN